MKKHLLIAGLICMATIPPAMAVTKCVKLESNMTCTPNYDSFSKLDWSLTCTTSNGKRISISGIAGCSNQRSNRGATSDIITTDNTSYDDYSADNNCWCKMTSPAVSQWVFHSWNTSTNDCLYMCAYSCADALTNQIENMSAMFSNLSD